MSASSTSPISPSVARIMSDCRGPLHVINSTARDVEEAMEEAAELGALVLHSDAELKELTSHLALLASEYTIKQPVKLARRLVRAAVARTEPRGTSVVAGASDVLPEGVDPFADLGNAHRLVRTHGADIRFCDALGGWRFYNGKYWRRDEAAIARLMMNVTTRLMHYAAALHERAKSKDDQQQADRYFDFARKSQSEPAIRRALELAKHLETVTTPADAWDRDERLFNCTNGTIDLRTCTLRDHRREDLITRIAPVAYDAAALAPTFDRFVAEVLPSDETRSFMQRFAGYSLTGLTTEQCLAILWGDGANGKSTFLELLKKALGDYAIEAAGETFLLSNKGRSTDNKLAGLRGARLVSSSESGEGRRLDETTVKRVTGGDELTANHLYCETFSFHATFKLWLCTNHRPEIQGVDFGVWRRVRLIPFTVTVPPERQDPELSSRLAAELPGVLAWMVRGCAEWQRVGLAAPQSVLAATAEWRDEANDVASFVADQCIVAEYAKTKTGALYAGFREWAASQGCEVLSAKAFGQRLDKLGFKADRTNAEGRIRRGIDLRMGGDDA